MNPVVVDQIVRQQEEIEALRADKKDAERYRFLRHLAMTTGAEQEKYVSIMQQTIPDMDIPLTEKMWDAAIDAAMRGEK